MTRVLKVAILVAVILALAASCCYSAPRWSAARKQVPSNLHSKREGATGQ
jgi:hypothetical protein